jgi:hypothetical protein
MQNLPIGIQSFRQLRENNFIYVDKTEHIFELVNSSPVYFLSRPRRFGKSLLISTLKELFLGNKALFKDLWIENKIEWIEYPVIHFDFAKGDFKDVGLRKSIEKRILEQAELYDIVIKNESISNQLEELIKKINKKYNQQVVLLIDEYDKPIIDFLGKDEINSAIQNREIMKEFYSPIKSLDNELRFFFMTGVTRFSKVSIFSDLNHLKDLTLHRLGETLLGYTQTELYHYFDLYIKQIASLHKISAQELKEEIKEWYNGYNFGGERLYNPFSILNFMDDKKFTNYWFETGTPTFLIKLVVEGGYYDMKSVRTNLAALGNFDITNLSPVPILFQTGYLTLKENIVGNTYRLGYPNKEVENSMVQLLLDEYTQKQTDQTTNLLLQLKENFDANDLESVFIDLNALFADIPYQIFETKKENYYHSVIFLTFKHLGYYATSEVSTSRGRIDAVVETKNSIYILEFKVNDTAQNALKQIKEKGYADKYLNQNKKIILIGVSFEDKAIKEYVVEELK